MSIHQPARRLAFSLAALAAAAAALCAPLTSAEAGRLKVEADLGQSVIETKRGQSIYLRLSLKAVADAKEGRRSPVNVALVLDKSGSMAGERIVAAKEAARLALERLSSDDWVSVVSFNQAVDVLLPAQHLRDQTLIRQRIDELAAGGQTAIHAGVTEGERQVRGQFDARRVNRIILMSDGQANVGPSSPKEFAELGRRLGGKGITVTTIGLGSAYNEDLMQQLASASDGNHAFARTPADLVRLFNLEFGDAQSITAQDIEIEIDIEAGFRPKRVLSRDADISGQRVKLRLNNLQADNERYLVVELEAPEALAEGEVKVGSARVRYLDIDTGAKGEETVNAGLRVSASTSEAEASVDKTVAAQVAVQLAVEDSRKAIELRDKGDIAGAKKILDGSVASTASVREKASAASPGKAAASPKVLYDLDELEKKAKAAAANLDRGSWEVQRKSMRHDQNTYGAQQKY